MRDELFSTKVHLHSITRRAARHAIVDAIVQRTVDSVYPIDHTNVERSESAFSRRCAAISAILFRKCSDVVDRQVELESTTDRAVTVFAKHA